MEILKTKNQMKIFFFIFIMFASCSSDKIYDKQLKNNEINLDWYHYSYISSSSPNYIVASKGDKEEIILEYGWGIQDIELRNDTITILHLKFYETPKVKKNRVFQYVVEYKETNADEVYLKHLKDKKQ